MNESGDNDLWTHLSQAVYGFIVPSTRTYATFGHSAGHGPMGVCYKCVPEGKTAACGGYCARDPQDAGLRYWFFDRWTAHGKPLFRLHCHCRSCRVAVGSNAVPWVTYRANDLALKSEVLGTFESSLIWMQDAADWERTAHTLPIAPAAGAPSGPPLAPSAQFVRVSRRPSSTTHSRQSMERP